MIQFNFTGTPYPSLQEQEDAKNRFLEKLGPFKDEFDANDGIATFNYSYPDTDNRRWSVVFGKVGSTTDIWEFIDRWNKYILSRRHISDPT